jgi:putative ABC transport system ATP-binding protein
MLQIESLTKTFNPGTLDQKKAIAGIDLSVAKGEFLTIIGSNGAGKSTLLNLIAGTVLPDLGQIKINGQTVTQLPEYRRAYLIGRIFQDPLSGTAATMTIEENLGMAELRGRPRGLRRGVKRSRRPYYRKLLESLELGLEDRMKLPVSSLSGGQRQSLTLLMATLNPPKLLLLDEHTAALDPKTAQKVMRLTEKIINTHHLTAMMVTHNMKQAIRYGRRMVMLHEGRIVFDVRDEVKQRLTVAEVVRHFGTTLSDEALLG